MPKRIIDGEALWQSGKLGQVQPARFRAEYANLIPLALANGSFECNPRAIWAKVYVTNRPDITMEDVAQILDEFERVKLLIRWTDNDGKLWGYWIGIDKPGRLPKRSDVIKKRYQVGAEPPIATVSRQYRDNNAVGVGIGSGVGTGSGKSITSTPKASSVAVRAEEDAPTGNSEDQNPYRPIGLTTRAAEERGARGLSCSSSPSDGGMNPHSICAAELKRRSKRNGGNY